MLFRSDAQSFAAKAEDGSISIDLNAGSDFIRGGFRAPSANAVEAFRLLGLMLAEPRFAAADIDRVRQQHISGLSREERDPRTLASRAWYSAAYPEHPYGRSNNGTAASLAAVTRDDMVAFVKARIARDNIKIGVVGDIDAAMGIIKRETGKSIVHIYGQSGGALRAAMFAQMRPQNVDRVVLDAFVWTGEGSPTLAKRREKLDQ